MNEEAFKKAKVHLKKINTLLAALGSLGGIASIWFGFSQSRLESKANLQPSEVEQLTLYLAHVCGNEAHAHSFESEGPASRYGNNAEFLRQMAGILKQ